jgi:type IV pilus assembly PilX-like protein
MHTIHHKREQGFSLIVALLALMLLSAVAVGMMFMASTETAVSANFKSEETAYFAARAGVEEVRDRMLPPPASPTGTFTNWLGQTSSFSINGLLPTCMPGVVCVPPAPWALYILNGKNPQTGNNMAIGDVADVTKLSRTNIVADDELCHDFPSYTGMSYGAANIPCSGTAGLPSGTSWYTSTTSISPLPVDFKWVRVTLKANNSYGGTNPALFVDSTSIPAKPAGGQVCWSGSGAGAHQVVADALQPCESLNASPVYLVTALAVSPSGGSNGAKRLVQLEIAQTYKANKPPDGLYAVGTGCGALDIAGNAQTGSFNSATPAVPPVLSGGNVGSNGNVNLGGSSTDVHGNVNTNLPASVGSCPANGVTVSGGAGYGSIANTPPYYPPTPPMPNPLPPTSSVTFNGNTLTAPGGPWGNVTIKGTVTLTGGTTANPAVYTMNSLSENGNATLVITGPVILNLAGVGVSTVLDLTGNSFENDTHVPSNFVINYGGSDRIKLNGGDQAYAVINAPNSAITFQGGSNFYGQAIGNTIKVQGNTSFWWDSSLGDPPTPNTDAFHEVAMRELSY